MKAIEINRKSWHYRLVRHAYPYVEFTDICQYSRRVIVAIVGFSFLAGLLTFLAGSILLIVGDFIAWALASIVMGGFVELGVGVVGVGLALALAGPIWIPYIWSKKELREKLDVPVVSAAYHAWKEKYCARVVIK